jgi:hypothetical protein
MQRLSAFTELELDALAEQAHQQLAAIHGEKRARYLEAQARAHAELYQDMQRKLLRLHEDGRKSAEQSSLLNVVSYTGELEGRQAQAEARRKVRQDLGLDF